MHRPKRGKRELRLRDGQHSRLKLKPTVPTHRSPVELVRPHVGREFKVVDEDDQRRWRHLAEGELGLEEVAPLDGADEASVRCPLAGHVPKGPVQATLAIAPATAGPATDGGSVTGIGSNGQPFRLRQLTVPNRRFPDATLGRQLVNRM
jgi:hypothetical protein